MKTKTKCNLCGSSVSLDFEGTGNHVICELEDRIKKLNKYKTLVQQLAEVEYQRDLEEYKNYWDYTRTEHQFWEEEGKTKSEYLAQIIYKWECEVGLQKDVEPTE